MPTISTQKLEGWPLTEARKSLSEVVRLAQKAPQLIHVNGESSGAVIGMRDLELLLELKKQRAAEALKKFVKVADEEGVYAEDFGDLRGKVKDIELK